MNINPSLPPEDTALPSDKAKQYRCGTLSYSLRGLLLLFVWMLWGDFCYTLMESVVPAVLPLKLKSLDSPNWLMAVVMATIPSALNMVINPWVSFTSDRYRSKRGRRIPFILGTLPFLCLSLLALGWVDPIAIFLRGVVPGLSSIAPATVTLGLLAIFVVAFNIFNLFVGSLICALFNDVVPPQLLGRFFGLFRIVGTLAGILFNAFIFKHSETHSQWIFTGGALIYFFGFGMMCLRVREGEYPPAPPAPVGSLLHRFVLQVKSFGAESFCHRFYWYFYLKETASNVAATAATFTVFFYKDMGLELEQIGWMGAIGMTAGVVATYLAAIYVDRWHPLRIVAYVGVFGIAVGPVTNLIWLPVSIPGNMFFWLTLGTVITSTFSGALNGNASYPMFMRVMPPSRYAQFCAASALVRSAGVVIASVAVGLFIDLMKSIYHTDYAYRFIFVWQSLFAVIAAVFIAIAYREWMRLGGDERYRAPSPWEPSGFESVGESASSSKSHIGWLMCGLRLYAAGYALFLLSIPVFLYLFHQQHLDRALWWYAWVFIPGILLTLWVWHLQTRAIRKDIQSAAAGVWTRYGVPHHGMMMAMAIQALLTLPIYWLQIGWTMRLGMEREMIWFGAATVIAFALNILVLHILRVMEGKPAGAAATRLGADGQSDVVAVEPVAVAACCLEQGAH